MKVKVALGESVRVFKCEDLDDSTLRELTRFVEEKFQLKDAEFVLQYIDEEKDLVTACDLEDLRDALSVAKRESKTLKLFVGGVIGKEQKQDKLQDDLKDDAQVVISPIESTIGKDTESHEDLFQRFFQDLANDEAFRNEFASFVCTFLDLARASHESPHTAFVQALSLHERVFKHPAVEEFASKVPLILGLPPVQRFLAMIRPELVPIYINEAVLIAQGTVPQDPVMPPFLVAMLQRGMKGEAEFPLFRTCGRRGGRGRGGRRGDRCGGRTQFGQGSLPKKTGNAICLRSDIVGDSHSLQDGTHVDPKQLFVKTWSLRNSGDKAWPEGTTVQYRGRPNNPMIAQTLFPVKGAVQPGETVDVSVVIEVPSLPGKFKSTWRLVTPNGRKFGRKMHCTLNCGAEQRPVLCTHADTEEKKRLHKEKRREKIRKNRDKLLAKLEKLNKQLDDGSDLDVEVQPKADPKEPVPLVHEEDTEDEVKEDSDSEEESEESALMYPRYFARF